MDAYLGTNTLLPFSLSFKLWQFYFLIFFEKEDYPRPLHLGDACSHFIDSSQKPYEVVHQVV